MVLSAISNFIPFVLFIYLFSDLFTDIRGVFNIPPTLNIAVHVQRNGLRSALAGASDLTIFMSRVSLGSGYAIRERGIMKVAWL